MKIKRLTAFVLVYVLLINILGGTNLSTHAAGTEIPVVQVGDYDISETLHMYDQFDYSDPQIIADETLFGVWDPVSESWTPQYNSVDKTYINKPMIDYSYDPLLLRVEEAVKSCNGNYTKPKALILEYYRKKFANIDKSSIVRNGTKNATVAANALAYNCVPKATSYYLFDVINTPRIYDFDVTDRISAVITSVNKKYTFALYSVQVDGFQAMFNSKEAADNKPYLRVVLSDNTVRTIYPDADTTLKAGNYSKQNFGSEPLLYVSERNNVKEFHGEGSQYPFIRFDLSQFNEGQRVLSANLYLCGSTDRVDAPKKVLLMHSTYTTWDENTLYWDDPSLIHNTVLSYDTLPSPDFELREDNKSFDNTNQKEVLMPLVERYSFDKREIYAYHAIRILISYHMEVDSKEFNHNYRGNNTPLAAGTGGGRLADAVFALINSEHMTPEAFGIMLKRVYRQCEWLLVGWNNGLSITTNHASYHNSGFANLVFLFPEFYKALEPAIPDPDSSSVFDGYIGGWLGALNHRLEYKSGEIILPDGSPGESPLSYNLSSFNSTVEAVQYAVEAAMFDVFSDEFYDNITRMALYFMRGSAPGYRDFQHGDSYMYSSEYIKSRPTIKTVLDYTNNQELLYAYTDGLQGKKPDFTSVVFPTGRQAIFRSSWDKKAVGAIFLADNSRTHAHPHDLAINIAAYGRYLLADPSNPNYVDDEPFASWMNTTRAHNTIEINDISQRTRYFHSSEVIPGPDGEKLVIPAASSPLQVKEWANFTDTELNQIFDYVKAETYANMGVVYKDSKGYFGPVNQQYTSPDNAHNRSVLYIKPGYFIVTDYVAPINGNTINNKYNQTWHFNPDANITMDSKMITKTNYNDVNIYVVPVEGNESKINPKIERGWYTFSDSAIPANYVSYVKTSQNKPATFNTILLPSDNGKQYDIETNTIKLDVPESSASAFEFKITDIKTDDTRSGTYYNIHNNAVKTTRQVGEYRTDGTLAFVEKLGNTFSGAIIRNGTRISKNNDFLMKATTDISELGIKWENRTIELSTSKNVPGEAGYVDLKTLTIRAEKVIDKVLLNYKEVPFKQQGNYVYFGNAPIIDDSTQTPEPSPTPSAGGNNGGNTHGGSKTPAGTPSGGSPSEGAVSNPVHSEPTDLFSAELAGHWGEKEIRSMLEQKIVKGDDNNSLSLLHPVTRAEFAALLVRALGLDQLEYNGEFADVNAGEWYAGYSATAKAYGLMDGSEGFAFPENTITREEMTKMLTASYRYLYPEKEVPDGAEVYYADDEDISDWAREYVKRASALGLLKGVGNEKFAPRADVLREQAFVAVYRLIQLE